MKRLYLLGLLVTLFLSYSSGIFAGDDHGYYERYPYHRHYRLYSGGDIYCSTCNLYHRSTHHHFRRYDDHHPLTAVERKTIVKDQRVIDTRTIVE